MIHRLRGRLLESDLTCVVIDAGGVGYGVTVSPQTSGRLPAVGEEVDLTIHTHVHENGIELYGFASPDDREVFLKLIAISGIGPRLGMTILAGMDAQDLLHAVADGDLARLVRIPGVGKKTAERIVVELKDRFTDLLRARQLARDEAAGKDPSLVSLEDVRSALLNFGYKPASVTRVLPLLSSQLDEGAGLQDLIREALRLLQRR